MGSKSSRPSNLPLHFFSSNSPTDKSFSIFNWRRSLRLFFKFETGKIYLPHKFELEERLSPIFRAFSIELEENKWTFWRANAHGISAFIRSESSQNYSRQVEVRKNVAIFHKKWYLSKWNSFLKLHLSIKESI